MERVERSALVPYSAEQMYQLVADIPRYPEFLKWCGGTEILSSEGETLTASITIAFKGLHKSFTTCNRMRPHESISVQLVDGPFSYLEGSWLFIPLDDTASKIELDLSFDFSSRVLSKIVGPVFSQIANSQVEAFHRRAQQLYD